MTLLDGIVLAQRAVQSPLGEPRVNWTNWIAAALALAVALLLIVTGIVSRWLANREQPVINSPWGLFKQLCTAHELNGRERRLLARLARDMNLNQPAAIFTEPTWFSADKLGNRWKRRSGDLTRLRDRLFAH